METSKRSRLMKLSWDIQRSRNLSRAKALLAAWAIMNNEHITVWYLVQRFNRHKPVKHESIFQMGLFTRNQNR